MLTKQTAFDTVFAFYKSGGKMGFDRRHNAIGIPVTDCIFFADDGGRCAGGVILAACGLTRERLQGTLETGEEFDFNHETNIEEVIRHFGTELTDKLHPSIYEPDRDATVVNNFLVTFMGRLQDVHDNAAQAYPDDIPYLLDKLEEFAKREGLSCEGR